MTNNFKTNGYRLQTGLRRSRRVLHGRLRAAHMNSMQSKTFARWLAAAAAVAVLAGCSSGGAPTVDNPVTSAPPVADYTGPASANADVQAFRINLWENIKANNRCGWMPQRRRPDAACSRATTT